MSRSINNYNDAAGHTKQVAALSNLAYEMGRSHAIQYFSSANRPAYLPHHGDEAHRLIDEYQDGIPRWAEAHPNTHAEFVWADLHHETHEAYVDAIDDYITDLPGFRPYGKNS